MSNGAYNHVTLVGNLVKDPDAKMVGKQAKTTFSIAVERYQGPDKEAAVDFFNVVSWGKLAEISGDYLKKGRKVLVDGRIQIRSYKKDEQQRWITEVVAENLKFLSGSKTAPAPEPQKTKAK
jgi:single-strand DNA-binding protein